VLILLLADRSACLRRRVLIELMGRDESDQEVGELAEQMIDDPLASNLLALQLENGAWNAGDGAWRPARPIIMTSLALWRLGYLGFGPECEAVSRGAAFLFARQRKDGSWPITSDESDTPDSSPLQTALPLRALAACGFAADARSELAYDWLLNERLKDGAWPTGMVEGNLRNVAGYRRLAHSEWGCRSNTTAALQCLALHPERCRSDPARRGLDLLLGRETRDAHVFGFEVARALGAETAGGFLTFFARFDVSLLLDLAARIGASRDDERVEGAVQFVSGLRQESGLWYYANAPQCSRWLSFDVLRSMASIDQDGDWAGSEPQTPFAPYRTRRDRF
jgi:hypothetical protein